MNELFSILIKNRINNIFILSIIINIYKINIDLLPLIRKAKINIFNLLSLIIKFLNQ